MENNHTVSENVFKKGSYVVLLSSCTGENSWKYSIPENYCYRLREDSNSLNFRIELDIIGSKGNGWYSTDPTYPSKLKIRLATVNEMEEYIRQDKPFDVSTIKNREPEDLTCLVNLLKQL